MTEQMDNVLKSLANQPGVIGTLIITTNGIPLRSTFKETETNHYAALISEFVRKSRACVGNSEVKPGNYVIRIRSHKNEIIITPDANYILIVVQDATPQP